MVFLDIGYVACYIIDELAIFIVAIIYNRL